MEIGDQVLYGSRRYLGVGVLTAFYLEGCCDVRFSSGEFAGIDVDDIVPIDSRSFAAPIQRERVMDLVRAGDLVKAEKLYENVCAAWWARREYEAQRAVAEAAPLEAPPLVILGSSHAKQADGWRKAGWRVLA